MTDTDDIVVKTIELKLEYYPEREDRHPRAFYGGVSPPEHTDELAVWAHPRMEFDEDLDDFKQIEGTQIQITGTRRALFELGRYFVALSQYETENSNYHDHIDADELGIVSDEAPCDLILRGPREPEYLT